MTSLPRHLPFVFRIVLMLAVLFIGATATKPAAASDILIAAAQRANAGLAGCNNATGTVLYTCVAGVLERMNSEISPANVQ
jgi:hypothetical protein